MVNATPVQSVTNRTVSLLSRRPILTGGLLFFAIILLTWNQWNPSRSQPRPHIPPPTGPNVAGAFDGVWNAERDRRNLLLNHEQCNAAFPGLFEEVDRSVRSRRGRQITVEEIDAIEPKNGYVRAMIYDQELYIINTQGHIYSREIATLQAIYRAIVSSPQPLPNIEFAFNTDDIIFESVPLWGFARKARDTHIWLIPDFGYWSWPETKVGTMRQVQLQAKIMEVNQGFTWSNKIPKLLWRGATMGLPLRDRLLKVTQGKPWADVIALDWRDKESMSNDLKSMPEHCQYKYLAHTEGNSYSGRLKYLQSCESVVIAHKMDWLQHYHPLMHSSGPEQNYVEVDRNFDNLERAIHDLEQDDAKARQIAVNNVKTFREQYLTPAAETCYWRALIRGWAEVSFEPQFYKEVNGSQVWRGLPVESFLLERRLKWDPY